MEIISEIGVTESNVTTIGKIGLIVEKTQEVVFILIIKLRR